jgi:cytochrome c oxidase assembly protein subunit 15
MNLSRLRKIIFLTVIYTIVVILWGAWVRISHSGDGCGDTWPLCRGQLIPEAERAKTWVEYTHRVMSGLYGILIVAIFFWTRKFFERGHRARKTAKWLLIFMIIEALLGAKLVLFGLVGSNDSFYRAFVIGIHQINSLLLTGTAALLFMTSSETESRPPLHFPGQAYVRYFGHLLIAMTGAWAALSSTLFPSESLSESFAKEFAPDSPLLMKLRSLHPALAIIIGISICIWLYKQISKANGFLKQVYLQTSALWAFAIVFGIMTFLLSSPVWMKISHLFLAHMLWISLLRLYYVRDQIS